ncbi:hypothetical protein O3P69_018249 [Scylla paramamosain]|uniref:Uncharacterized protein n=1 Tax=Scylla paramamosain TaxID=85552 RepID=A0AAW0TKF5_SCYPA
MQLWNIDQHLLVCRPVLYRLLLRRWSHNLTSSLLVEAVTKEAELVASAFRHLVSFTQACVTSFLISH